MCVAICPVLLLLVGKDRQMLLIVHPYYNTVSKAWMPLVRSLRVAVVAVLRPILMTAIATILVLTPMASGLSQSSGFIAAPLALTIIGGLASSTVLTLLLVPTLYVLVEGRGRRASKPPVEEERVVPVAREEQTQQAPA